MTALPYICKRSNSTREQQPPDPQPTGGCPPGWSQFLNKVGSGEGAPKAKAGPQESSPFGSIKVMASCLYPPPSLLHGPSARARLPVPGPDSLETKSA